VAVYTKVSEDALKEFLSHYDIGELQSYEGIEQGVENTNYHLFTSQGRYILTLFEKRVDPESLPFIFGFVKHLREHGITTPDAVEDKQGHFLGALENKIAAIVHFLEGQGADKQEITPDRCQQVGAELAKMHKTAQDFDKKRKNDLSLEGWKGLHAKTKDRADEVEKGLGDMIEAELKHLERFWPQGFPKSLPSGVIHADLFPDNVFFKGGFLSGVIDFYFACTDFYVYELAITINAWCFDDKNLLRKDCMNSMLQGYESVRSLNDTERSHLSLFCRGAALRFLMTRLHDWVFHNPEDFVKPKDPGEYIQKLKFHQSVDLLKLPDEYSH